MRQKIITHLRGQWAGFLALALVLGGGTAYATASVVGAAEGWHNISAGSSTSDACANATVDVFCSIVEAGQNVPWHNYGAPFAHAGYYKDQVGIVHLKGLVTDDLDINDPAPRTTAIFILPSGYRPTHQRVFPVVGRYSAGLEVAAGRVDVEPDGTVLFEWDCYDETPSGDRICSATDGGYVTLDSISFRPAG